MSTDRFITIIPEPVIIIYDTEFTTWEGAMARGWSGPGEHRELVQIAAQKIDLREGIVIDSFECLVRPQINPELSKYFVDLTGITNTMIKEEGVAFTDMYHELMTWAGSVPLYSYSKNITDYTDADVLAENIRLGSFDITLPREQFRLLTPVFVAVGIDTKQFNSGKLYQAFGLDLSGHEHNAMFDVTSLVASLLAAKERLIKMV